MSAKLVGDLPKPALAIDVMRGETMQITTALKATAAAVLVAGPSLVSGPAFSKDIEGGNTPVVGPIDLPNEDNRGVFIDQIGLDNLASSEQENSRGYARVVQQGDENTVDILQRNGSHYAVVAQDGDRNSADVEQSGEGRAILILSQQGINNGASLFQSETGTSYSAAAISQTGEANSLMLVQDGEDNQARLSQDGSGNAMTATQLGASNRLEWAQNGDGLSDLAIEQTGGSTMYVLQTNGGGN
ncbi:hypothetical protein J7348_11150 [Qipengyuania flava]|uniref:hypothetical protein n=1 Tax=Qipengyuania flava TaxID=192812 RepID=UPI001ADC76D1|nr:hypothetical protein [Qipengyuania flava]MBO9505177.1 hypothetical protein [Qipengyuania flava]